MPKVVIVCTSASDLNGHKTGLWLEELAAPYYLFRDKGYQVVVASPKGGEIPVDSNSLQGDAYVESAKDFMEDEQAQSKLRNSVKIADVDFSTVDCIYLAGGHGTCVDFVGNLELKQAIEKVDAANKVVAAVCHGPTGLVQCVKPNGKPLVAGRTVTAFSDSEEAAVNLGDKVPYLLESKLKEQKANYSKGDDWAPYVRVDGNLLTGQNPASSEMLAKEVVKILG
jgi:putative intracellular protease/amidase